MRALFAIVLLLSPVGALAATTGEEDTLVIKRINQSDFEVVESQFMGAAEYWCGAATFIERRSGLSELTPIYLKRAIGPSLTTQGRKGVVFSTSNTGLPPDPGLLTLTVKRPGAMLKSVKARRYCRDAFTRSTK